MHLFVLTTFFVYFQKIAEDKVENREKRKAESTAGAKGVALFKEGKYKEAITQFTTYLKTKQDDENKKVAHYNRGMAHYNLGQHESALEDGEECLKIDPFWAKGYKCKGLALEGLGMPRDATKTFLEGQKMCFGCDQNTEAVLRELIKRSNRVTGYLGDDLDLSDRKRKEKYCVACDLFEKDMSRSPELGDGEKFISCDRCKMVNYCCQEHRKKDRVTHNEVCEELQILRKKSEEDFDVEILAKEDALVLLALKPRGPKGQQMVDMMKKFDLPRDFKNIMDYLRGVGDGNLMPLYQLGKFKPITKKQQKELNTWDDLFAMLDMRTRIPKMTTDPDTVIRLGTAVEEQGRDFKRPLTYVLTDPMTVFYAMKQVTLLDNGDEDKIMRLHVVGAEPRKEILKIKVFYNVMLNLTGRKLHIVYIGPLLISPPGHVQILNPVITIFRGTYQDYILTSDYEKPDCIVAFFAGLYNGTYNWLPAVAQAIAKKVPFLVTCDSKEDHQKTKEWLMKRSYMKPEIVQDYLNPFSSWEVDQHVSGSNSFCKPNMFSLLIIGGDLDVLGRLLRVKDEKVELLQVLFRFQKKDALCDILKLKKSGKI